MVDKTSDSGRNIVELVELLQQVDKKQTYTNLNQYSMRNYYYRGLGGDDSELRTWFYHYKTLEKNGIIRGKK